MGGEDRNPVDSAPRRRRLSLRAAVLVTAVGAAAGAVLVESLVAGSPHQAVTHLVVRCDSEIDWQDPGGSPTEISGGRKVRLPGGGGFACGQLVEPGGSEPVAVDLWTGTLGLSATMQRVTIMDFDVSNPAMNRFLAGHMLARMSFSPRQEYLLALESDPDQADMLIYSGNDSSMLISVHLVFRPGL